MDVRTALGEWPGPFVKILNVGSSHVWRSTCSRRVCAVRAAYSTTYRMHIWTVFIWVGGVNDTGEVLPLCLPRPDRTAPTQRWDWLAPNP